MAESMEPGPAWWRCCRWAVLLSVALGGLTARGGSYMIQAWGVDEGLPQSSVTDVAQTPDGYLWIGTLLGGISRFDGLRFVNFSPANTPSLPTPGVRRLLVDSAGDLWLNDYAGNLFLKTGPVFQRQDLVNVRLGSLVLDRPDIRIFSTLEGELVRGRSSKGSPWRWDRFKPPHPANNPYYHADHAGRLYYRWPGERLGRFDNGLFEVFDSPPGLEGKRIQVISRDLQGDLWVGTEAELARWDGTRFLPVPPPGGEQRASVRHILPAGPKKLWVEINRKLHLLDGGQWTAVAEAWDGDQAPWSRLRFGRHDGAGGLWLSLQEEALAHVEADGRISRITAQDNLPSQVVQTFFPDREGNLWAGYHRGGLVRVRQRLFQPVARQEGLGDVVVTSISQDPQGAIWIGTASGTVARYWDGVCSNFTLPRIGSFCQDAVVAAGQDGKVWVGTGGNGLLVREGGFFRHVIQPGDLAAGVRMAVATRDGALWFANTGGLYRFRDRRPELMLGASNTLQVVSALCEGPDGSVWAGTVGGTLWRHGENGWTRHQPEDGHLHDRFWALRPESAETVWIGTMSRGLLRFEAGCFTRFTARDGLPDDSISQVLLDRGDHLWLGSRAGVVRVPKAALERRAAGAADQLSCRVFGRSDGLLTTAMTLEFQPNCLQGWDGRLWFGTANGAAWTEPGSVASRRLQPPVVIEEAYANGQAIPLRTGPSTPSGKPGDVLSPSLTIGPGVRTLGLQYSSPSMTAPELTRFRIKLEGVDPDWVEQGPRRSITYSMIPPGRYHFRVTACNGDGVWNQDGASLNLELLPYVWERRSVQGAAAALAVGGLVLGVMSAARHRLKRRLERLERQQVLERERARIAQDLHDDLGAGLTEISLTSDLAQAPSLGAPESRQYIQEIGSRARELVESLDEIVWAVNPRNDTLASLAAYICQHAARLLRRAGIRCRLDVQDALPAIPLNAEQRYQLFLAFKEAVTNLARHSRCHHAQIAIRLESDRLHIAVEDDGCGFQAGPAPEGADGLRNMRERLVRLGGNCAVRSEAGRGTCVQFTLPIPGIET